MFRPRIQPPPSSDAPPRRHSAPATRGARARRAFTLIELVLATSITALLLAGVASLIMLSSAAATRGDGRADADANAAAVLDQLAAELTAATEILAIDQPGHAVRFVVPDRDASGQPEIILYAWSGNPGEPLTRSINAADPLTVLPAVDEFAITPVIRARTTTAEPNAESPPVSVLRTELASRALVPITPTGAIALVATPSIFNASAGFVTRADVRLARRGATDGSIAVQIRRVTGLGTPDPAVALAEVVIPESDLPATPDWVTVRFPGDGPSFNAGERLAVVLVGRTGIESASLEVANPAVARQPAATFSGIALGNTVTWAGISGPRPAVRVFAALSLSTSDSASTLHATSAQIRLTPTPKAARGTATSLALSVPLPAEPEVTQ